MSAYASLSPWAILPLALLLLACSSDDGATGRHPSQQAQVAAAGHRQGQEAHPVRQVVPD